MISKGQIKLITSLQQKKYRTKTGLFVAEGEKIISEFLDEKWELHSLFSTKEDLFNNQPVQLITEEELSRISFLKSPNTALAVFKIPKHKFLKKKGLIVALDAVRDPGNLGTIIRLCDWFGVSHLVCSPDTVDCFNPKVVQGSMGSLSRVALQYTDLKAFLSDSTLPILGSFMKGKNVYKTPLPKEVILVMGNEANGISPEIEELVITKISIPRFGNLQKTESLNVATATAILLSEFVRR